MYSCLQQQLINLFSTIKLFANYADDGLTGNEQSDFYFYFPGFLSPLQD